MATGFQVTFDAADPDALARFWADVLGYQLQPPPEGHESWESFLRSIGVPESEWDKASAIVDPDGTGARLYFQKVPETKMGKNRVHLDVNAGGPRGTPPDERRANVEKAVARAVALGGRELYRKDENQEFWVTMADPEGNEFCLQ